MCFATSHSRFSQYSVYFAIVLGALIVVHEFGHFIVAKKSGVIRVERFSIGFGPALWRMQWRGTEYRLRWCLSAGTSKCMESNSMKPLVTQGLFLASVSMETYSHCGSRPWF